MAGCRPGMPTPDMDGSPTTAACRPASGRSCSPGSNRGVRRATSHWHLGSTGPRRSGRSAPRTSSIEMPEALSSRAKVEWPSSESGCRASSPTISISRPWRRGPGIEPSSIISASSSRIIGVARQQARPREPARRLYARGPSLGLSARRGEEDPAGVRPALRGPLHADRQAPVRPILDRPGRFAEPPDHLAITKGIPAHNLRIPPGVPDHVVHTFWRASRDLQLLSLTPHMHLRARASHSRRSIPTDGPKSSCQYPDTISTGRVFTGSPGRNRSRKGPRSTASALRQLPGNPANPDPTCTVTWGEQSEDEMMIGFIDYY